MEHCFGVPGIVYNFNNQNLVTFEDNLGYKSDLPVVAYIYFETTAPTDSCFDPKQKKMFIVLYVTLIAFHQKLKMNSVIIQRSFGHSLEQLTTINYLTNDQMPFVNINLIKQLKDCALEVSQKKCKNALAQMFSIELCLVQQPVLSWFNKKIKSQHLEIDLSRKNKYEKDHPINWNSDKCLICNFPLKIDPIGPDVPNNEMSYRNFYIRHKDKFLRNIYSKEQLERTPQIKTLQEYYKTFQKFIKICVSLQSVLVSHINFDDSEYNDHELKDFLQNKCADQYDNFDKLWVAIEGTEIKNIVKNTSYKIPRFNLKLYTFV